MNIVCPSCKNKQVPYGPALSQVFLGPRKGLVVKCGHCRNELVADKRAVLTTAAIALFGASVFTFAVGFSLIFGFFLFLVAGLFFFPILVLSGGSENDKFGLLPWLTRGGLEKFLQRSERDFTEFVERQKEVNSAKQDGSRSASHRFRQRTEGTGRHSREKSTNISGVHGDASDTSKHRYARGGERWGRHTSLGSPKRSSLRPSGRSRDHSFSRKPETRERHEPLGSLEPMGVSEPMGSRQRLTRHGREAAQKNAGRNYTLELREARVELSQKRTVRVLCPRCSDAYFEPRPNKSGSMRIRCPSCGLSDE